MKIRNDFVTNSSSSSFILQKGLSRNEVFSLIQSEIVAYKNRFQDAFDYLKAKGYEPSDNKYGGIKVKFPNIPDDDAWTKFKYMSRIENKFDIDLSYGPGKLESDYVEAILESKDYDAYVARIERDVSSSKGYVPHFVIATLAELKSRTDSYAFDEIIDWYSDEDTPEWFVADKDKIELALSDNLIVYQCDPGMYLPHAVIGALSRRSIEYCAHMG